MNGTRIALVLSSALVAVSLAACDQNRPGETAGDKVDSAIESAKTQTDKAADSVANQANKAEAYLDDAAITTKVKAEIVKDDALKLSQIDVTTTQGVVMLSGEVDSQSAVTRAEEVARAIEGVKSVQNGLMVKGS